MIAARVGGWAIPTGSPLCFLSTTDANGLLVLTFLDFLHSTGDITSRVNQYASHRRAEMRRCNHFSDSVTKSRVFRKTSIMRNLDFLANIQCRVLSIPPPFSITEISLFPAAATGSIRRLHFVHAIEEGGICRSQKGLDHPSSGLLSLHLPSLFNQNVVRFSCWTAMSMISRSRSVVALDFWDS